MFINQLQIEYDAFNFTSKDVVNKMYIRVLNEKNDNPLLSPNLDEDNILLMSTALDNKYLLSLLQTRYSIYDISFRKLGNKKSIGFSFNDVADYEYITPEVVFEPFKDLGIDSFVNTVNNIQGAMFHEKPQFNPVFMIGLLISEKALSSVKAYIRIDIKDNSLSKQRMIIIDNIINKMNPEITKNDFRAATVALEKLGLTFNFVGVDYKPDNSKRYKLYFRNYNNILFSDVSSEFKTMLLYFGLKNELNIIESHSKEIWGIAISTNNFQDVNGIQLYLYP